MTCCICMLLEKVMGKCHSSSVSCCQFIQDRNLVQALRRSDSMHSHIYYYRLVVSLFLEKQVDDKLFFH